jgi:hypothetical protein
VPAPPAWALARVVVFLGGRALQKRGGLSSRSLGEIKPAPCAVCHAASFVHVISGALSVFLSGLPFCLDPLLLLLPMWCLPFSRMGHRSGRDMMEFLSRRCVSRFVRDGFITLEDFRDSPTTTYGLYGHGLVDNRSADASHAQRIAIRHSGFRVRYCDGCAYRGHHLVGCSMCQTPTSPNAS